MNLRFVDWIWHVRGSLTLAPGQSRNDALDRLDPLFRQTGTTRDRTNDRLIFRKRDQAAQDKMAVFDGGVLQIEGEAGSVLLRYDLTSRALLFCFLMPLLFLGIAQLTIVVVKYQTSSEAADKSAKAAEELKAAKKADMPMNPLDKALGAPAPEKPGKKGADKADEHDKKPTPTPAYVFAAIFATLYLIGRMLEARLVKALFRKRLLD